MAVHTVYIHCQPRSNRSLSDIAAAANDWLDSQDEWTADTISHGVRVTGDYDGLTRSTEWLLGVFRLTTNSDSVSAFLDQIESALNNHVEWYRIGHHLCAHDDAVGAACPPMGSWDNQREYTRNNAAIPTDVEMFVEAA